MTAPSDGYQIGWEVPDKARRSKPFTLDRLTIDRGKPAIPQKFGFKALARVRRRQDAGVRQLENLYPGLTDREGKPPLKRADLARMALQDPTGFATYAAVSLAVKTRRGGAAFTRGR